MGVKRLGAFARVSIGEALQTGVQGVESGSVERIVQRVARECVSGPLELDPHADQIDRVQGLGVQERAPRSGKGPS